MRIIRTVALASLFALIIATQTGCLVAAAGAAAAGTVAYVRGDLEAVLDHDVQAVSNASKTAVEEMKLALVSHNATTIDGQTVARTADDTKIEINVKSVSDKSSRISIRVGTFGDQALSMNILDKIKARLGRPATTQASG